MTFSPATLDALGAYWTAQGGRNLGVVGNASHTQGYHLGRDRIYDGSGPGLGDGDYSVRLARDKAGLTDAASAIDLGKLDGSLPGLRMFSVDLVARCLADPGTRRDIREIIYSPDGATVQRYSSVDNAIHTGPGNGDDSHLTHTHISYHRDSEDRDKIAAFRPYFEEDVVQSFVLRPGPPGTATVAGPGHSYLRLSDGTLHPITDGASKTPAYPVRLTPGIGSDSDVRSVGYLVGVEAAFLLESDVWFTAADCTAEADAARTAEKERIAAAEADRVRAL